MITVRSGMPTERNEMWTEPFESTTVNHGSLDESIQALTDILSDECGRYDGGGWYLATEEEVRNAIAYLKEYRELRNQVSDMREEAFEAIEQIRLDVIKQFVDNPPLTWDELQAMEGKPVWVEEQYSFTDEWHGCWEVISSFCDDEYVDDPDPVVYMTNEEIRHKDNLGKTWQAYRKERE